MMLTIQGLPTNTTYQELKRIIKQECNITDFILDSLVMDDDGCKKVRIGVTDDGDGSHLMKYLNGYHYSGHVIRVVPVGKPNQQNQVNFDARGGYPPRNDYHNNFGNRAMANDSQPPRSNNWGPNVQWGHGMPSQVPQHTFPNQPITSVVNNNFTQQPARGFVPGGVSQHAQNFGYGAKGNVLDVPIAGMKDTFQGSSQFHHQPMGPGHFQAQSHVQPGPWQSQVQTVKPAAGGYNQIGFNDNRQVPKQGVGNAGVYKDYDKGDRRFPLPTRDSSPGRRPSRMSPDPSGRRMSPTGNQGRRASPPGNHGRRMSPAGHQSRRMSPPGHQGRRMSPPPPGPPGRIISPGNHGRRMTPPRMGGPVPTARGMSPSRHVMSAHGHKLSPIAQGRRLSPGSYHRASPSGPQGRRMSPPGPQGRRMSPPGPQGRRMSPPGPQGRRISPPGPPGRRMSPSGPPGRRMSPPGPPGRRMSPPGPPGRRMSPPGPQGRRMSPPGPPGRRMSPPGPPGRRMSPPGPPGRRVSPVGTQGRRISPPGLRTSRESSHGMPVRRMSPSGRRISPGRREPSPERRMSPNRRRTSPGRQSPGRRASPSRRLSPKRHSPVRRSVSPRHRSPLLDAQGAMRGYPGSYQQTKKAKYDDDEGLSHLKHVRPAYEPPTKAPNQAMYSGGYRPNVRENVQYPASSTRTDPWQKNDKPATYAATKIIDSRIEKFDMPRGSELMRMGDTVPKRSRSGTRDSRSPVRRDRSPLKDRYRRHSPSPRSPRRSWALEKRRSPDDREAPPPPVWPGQTSRDTDFARQNRQHFTDVAEKIDKKSGNSWDRPSYEDKNDVRMNRREKISEPRPFVKNNPALEKWKPLSQAGPNESLSREDFRQDERFPENIRDSHNYTASKEQFRRPSSVERMSYAEKRDFRDYPTKKDDHVEMRRKKDISSREDFPRSDEREPFRTNTAQLNKEIEDVYKRVAELGKKAQEYRKKDNLFEDDCDDEYFDQNDDEIEQERDTRREFLADARFQDRDEDARSRRSNEEKVSSRQRESRWSSLETSEVWRPKKPLSPSIKAKRDKAAEELTRRILNKFKNRVRDHQKSRVHDELTLSISHILFDMFKYEDISYIELIIKFNKKYDANDEQKIFEDVMSSFSSNYRKRLAKDNPEVPVKTSKRSPDAVVKDETKGIGFTKPNGPIRPRKTIAAPETRNFQSPRANTLTVNPKLKIADGKVRSQEAKISNIESKPIVTKNLVQNAKILNKETNNHAQQTALKKVIKRLTPKSPPGINKLAMQKKKLLTALKTKASIQLASVEETPSVPTAKKIMKDSKMQIQQTKPQEEMIVEKNKLETEISSSKKKAEENDTSIPMIKGKNNTSLQRATPPENTPSTKSSPESTENIKPTTQEKKVQKIVQEDKAQEIAHKEKSQETHENDKVSAAISMEEQTTPSKTEVSSTEKYELDPILTRAVEDVLQDVMIQVWQELPDDPSEEEDRVAVDQLRNEAGDDLRRVLGLNITKRLLNVYNNLFVKMKFTCRPQMGCLTSFLKEHHINNFKRIDKNSNTFAAQMETIEEFDKLCTVKELMCGEAKVNVTPCYKFTQCPENLKTIYDDSYYYEDTPQEPNESLKNNTQTSKVIASNENIGKPAADTENTDAKSPNKLIRTEVQKTASSVRNHPEGVKKKSITIHEEKTSPAKVIITNNAKPKTKDIDNVPHEEELCKDIGKDIDICDYIVKDNSESGDDDFESGVPENQMESEDELDDEDILALMSEGVVVDECSASEEEN